MPFYSLQKTTSALKRWLASNDDLFRPSLDDEEKNSFLELQKIKLNGIEFTNKDWNLNESILRARHTTTFHYDAARIRECLDRWLLDRGAKEKGYVVVQDDGKRPTYYSVADMVRAETAFGLSNVRHEENIRDLFTLVNHLTTFTDGIFIAYMKHNKLQRFIREEFP